MSSCKIWGIGKKLKKPLSEKEAFEMLSLSYANQKMPFSKKGKIKPEINFCCDT
jgi:hypothetical protein